MYDHGQVLWMGSYLALVIPATCDFTRIHEVGGDQFARQALVREGEPREAQRQEIHS